jgi:hypothetical protein
MELAALPATGHERSGLGCWADNEKLQAGMTSWACGDPEVDDLGLCAFHRTKLFGKAS